MAKKYAEREEQFIKMKFLMGLINSYANTRGQILLMNPLPLLNQNFHLCSEERQTKFQQDIASNGSIAM